MKKRWIPPVLALIALAILGGIWLGASAEYQRIEDARAQGETVGAMIAVVNTDTGVVVDGVNVNYAAAIIETLGEGYLLVSPAMAQSGLEQGTHRAVLTFPSDVSERIIAFNTGHPERVQLEFQVNPRLSESQFLETYTQLLDLQMAVNLTLAHTYISSILTQFHAGQDEVGAIFLNDTTNINALEYLSLQAFTTSLQLEALPELPFEPNEADTAQHLVAVTNFARDVSALYLNSYREARESFFRMRYGLIALTDDFPEQKDEWLGDLDRWIGISVDYRDRVILYSNRVHGHRGEMDEWHGDLFAWWLGLDNYHDGLVDWEELLQGWYGGEEERVRGWTAFIAAVEAFGVVLEGHRFSYYSDFSDASELLGSWQQELFDTHGPLYDFFHASQDNHTAFNHAVGRLNQILRELHAWQEELEDIHTAFSPWETLLLGLILLGDQVDELPAIPGGPPNPANFIDNPAGFTAAANNWLAQANAWRTAVDAIDFPDATDPSWAAIMDLFDELRALPYEVVDIPGELDAFPAVPPLRQPPDTPPYLPGPPGPFPEPDDELIFGGIASAPPTIDEDLQAPPKQGKIPEFDSVRPLRPDLDEPPMPDDFWAALGDMHGQLLMFDPYAFLTDAIRQDIENQLAWYDEYLGTIRLDLAAQFAVNVGMLMDVRSGYTQYLTELRAAALEAESVEMENLRERVGTFHEVAERTSGDTRARLAGFSGMLPHSRTEAGVNRELVDFSVAPIAFVAPTLRTAVEAATDGTAGLAMFGIWIAAGVFGLFVLIAVLMHGIDWVKRRKLG